MTTEGKKISILDEQADFSMVKKERNSRCPRRGLLQFNGVRLELQGLFTLIA